MTKLAQRTNWLHLMLRYAPKHKQKKRYPNPLPKRRKKTRPKKSRLTMKNLLLKKLLPTLQRKPLKETSKLLKQLLMLRVSLKRRGRLNPEARDVRTLRVNAVDATEIEAAAAVVVAEVEEAEEETTTEDHPLTKMASKLQERSPRLNTVTEITKVAVEDVTLMTKITTAELEMANVVEEDPKLLSPEKRETTTKPMKAKLRSEPSAFQKHLNKKNKLKSEIPTKIVQQNALKNHLDAICGQRVVY